MAEGPVDVFKHARLLLARQRELGRPFTVAWRKAIEALDRPVDRSFTSRDRNASLAMLEATSEDWRAAYEREPPPKRRRTLPVPVRRAR